MSAVLLDFYGTLAESTQWVSADSVLAEHGYEMPREAMERWFNDGIDGQEHLEHSRSRDHYIAWQRERTLGMLAETDVHPGEYELILEKLQQGRETRVLEAYPEVPDVLTELRCRGLVVAVCSNWDWDLLEAIDDAGLDGLTDVVVSSAWAGARKPHPRIFRHTLEKVGVEPADALFVGDSWGPDVEGPLAVGLTPCYISRAGHWPDPGAPSDAAERAIVIESLDGVLEHC